MFSKIFRWGDGKPAKHDAKQDGVEGTSTVGLKSTVKIIVLYKKSA